MLRIDKAILDTSGVICDNIARFGATERGLLSQNILGHIRNFVEYVAIKAFSNGADVNPYAVSIHKAQGLEYDSVKIVITNEVEERITHNIFYTAITRAKNKLKIYWSPETEKSVLEHLEVKNSNKDAHLLAQLFSIAMTN